MRYRPDTNEGGIGQVALNLGKSVVNVLTPAICLTLVKIRVSGTSSNPWPPARVAPFAAVRIDRHSALGDNACI